MKGYEHFNKPYLILDGGIVKEVDRYEVNEEMKSVKFYFKDGTYLSTGIEDVEVREERK
ncbi:hypothetical protein [Bacillus cereus]|uniref:hypothetical protein n=1 Tax=Bacillus cereus TaxID=1396 RepID=UPI0035C99E3D